MPLRDRPLAEAEFLAVDTETNGRHGEACELTEVAAVLVGGGETHDEWAALVRAERAPTRAVQRLTGIAPVMLADGVAPAEALRSLADRLEGRVLVAHGAAFDRRVLRQAFARAGLPWPDPPTLCTVALARRFAPLATQRRLAALAGSLGIEVEGVHRALVDARTCGRVFCALFGRLRAHAATVGEAVALLAARRRVRGERIAPAAARRARHALDFGALPSGPGVYIFRDAAAHPLYVGKSLDVRARARTHFVGANGEAAAWRAHAALVDAVPTRSELGALVLENRLIKQWRPPGNVALKRDDRWVYLRCRLDIAFPVLELAPAPAPGHAVNVGPLRGRRAASELVEQLTSLFGLRHCGRALPRRDHPSAYGQMGRCLSPCLRDLDPNLYRQRLDAALALFDGARDGRDALLATLDDRMRAASDERRYERAAWLRRRRERLEVLLRRLGGTLRAAHAASRLVLAPHPGRREFDAFWIIAGRVADWGPLPGAAELAERTARALRGAPPPGRPGPVAPGEVDELRIVAGWTAAHPEARVLELRACVDRAHLECFVSDARERWCSARARERQCDDLRADRPVLDGEPRSDLGLTAQERQTERSLGR